MEYGKGHVYELMDQGGPTDNREPYFKEAVDEMMRARTLCAKANATLPDDPSYVGHLAILSASGGIEFGDGVQVAPGVRIATINHDFNARHSMYTYGRVTIKKNAWIGMNVTICPGVTIGEYAVVGAGAVVTKDVPDYGVAVGTPAKVIKMLDPNEQQE